jgi:DNA-binding MarR family transcriptional regulator
MSVGQETDPFGELSTRPGFLIRRLHQIHLALFHEECSQFGITPVQYSLISVLATRTGFEQASVAAEIGVDRATVADVLSRLEGRGLVTRRPSPTDKRLKLVSLSEEGRALLARMHEAARRAHDRTLDPLSALEREQFLRTLSRLVEANNEYGRAPLRLA